MSDNPTSLTKKIIYLFIMICTDETCASNENDDDDDHHHPLAEEGVVVVAAEEKVETKTNPKMKQKKTRIPKATNEIK